MSNKISTPSLTWRAGWCWLALLLVALFINSIRPAHAFPPNCSVVGWGADWYGQTTTPAILGDVVAFAAGGGYGVGVGDHNLALKADGTVVGWGDNTYDQATPPAGLSDVVAISAGAFHNLALKAGGTVIGWGNNYNGQATPPAGLSDVVAIDAGDHYGLALKVDGTVIGWGSNSSGQATPPAGLSDVVAISAGAYHSLALKADGTVIGWGSNYFGQTTPPAGLSDVVAISAGTFHSLALKADGTVVGWGADAELDGQATPPVGLSDVVAISAGAEHSLALKSDGTVVGWGNDFDNQATPPAGLSDVVAISAGAYHSLALQCTPPNDAPIATDDSYSTNEDTPLAIPAPGVLSNDSDVEGDSLTALVVSNPSHGTLTLNANGSFTYTPAPNYSGSDSFTYKANDGGADSNIATVTITVISAADLIDGLIAEVQALVDNGGNGNALIVKLQNAQKKLMSGKPDVAINNVQAFINQVNAFSGNQLTPAQAQQLINAANAIIAALN